MKKTEKEIEKLIAASKLTDNCFRNLCRKIKVGMTEKDVAKIIDDYFFSHGASALAFDTIVGSGENSSIIHSKPSDRVIKNGDIIQLDFGCVLDGYCSDCSRVLFMGKVRPVYKKIYEIVLESQLAGIKKIKVDMTASEADAVSRDVIKSYGYDFKHALGHGVGKVVHDEPVISPKNTKDIIENNMVFTIEPGIYFDDDFGIRIEDTCIMRDGKVIPLNRTSKEIKIIE